MPTLLRVDGFRFFFFSNEGNKPPHVHVESGDGYAKIWLDPLEFVYAVGLHANQLRRVRRLVKEHREDFIGKWNEHFGA